MTTNRLPRFGSEPGVMAALDGDMVELALLLPNWQAEALESAAQELGLTTGEMVRQLLRNFCSQRRTLAHLNQSCGQDS